MSVISVVFLSAVDHGLSVGIVSGVMGPWWMSVVVLCVSCGGISCRFCAVMMMWHQSWPRFPCIVCWVSWMNFCGSLHSLRMLLISW